MGQGREGPAGTVQESKSSGIAAVRRAYAERITALAGVTEQRIVSAFAAVPREAFLGPGPWRVHGRRGSATVPQTDLEAIYDNVLITLDEARGVNTGEPSLHALMLAALEPRDGERVLHVGAGRGYYSAILAELVGQTGSVTAVEVDARLAAEARRSLAPWPQVRVVVGDGAEHPAAEVDRVYVNAAVTRPAPRWLDWLAPGGRIVLPLGVPSAPAGPGGPRHAVDGGVIVLERTGSGFAARWLCAAVFVMAEGALAPQAEETAIRRAFATGMMERIKSLVRGPAADPARCPLWTPEWALSLDPA